MILDYNSSNETFILKGADPDMRRVLMKEHGLDYSEPADVYFTQEPYSAVNFWHDATDRARTELKDIWHGIAASRSQESQANIECPPDQQLYPFQVAGVDYCRQRKTGALIGDQPGLGKTAQAICLANEFKAKRVLVICPANIRLQWAYNIRDWSTMPGRPIIYPILKSADGVHPTAHWTILSYDLTRSEGIYNALIRAAQSIKTGKYDLVILDEAHYLKNWEAQRTRQVFGGAVYEEDELGDRTRREIEGLAKYCGYTLALTGTPLPNRPKECYTLARNLCWDSIDWMSEQEFIDAYNPSEVRTAKKGHSYTYEETGRLPELNARLRSYFMVRRLKREVLTQLPQVTHEITHIEEDGKIRKALQAEQALDIDPTNLAGADAKLVGHVSVVRRLMGVAMAPHVADYASMILDGGEPKLFVAGWHKEVLDIYEQRLAKWGVVRVDGRTTPARKQIAVDKFMQNPDIKVFIGNLLSAGVGTDGLQKVCSHGILGECSWVPGDNEQIVSRLDRIGQELPVLFEYMTVPGSFSEKILGTSLRKLQGIHQALDKEI